MAVGASGGGAPAFSLRGACVTLAGTEILNGIDLECRRDGPIALIGPSGAGKTTLLRLIATTVAPSSGQAETLGAAPRGLGRGALRRLRARVGFIHQAHALVPMLRTVQNVAAGRLAASGTLGGLRRVLAPSQSEAAEIYEVLERVGVERHLYARVDRLSGGEQQRVAIARTLYQEPDLILADEPVSSVDPERARAVLSLLVELAGERDVPLVASLHDVELAMEFFPRVIGLRGGRVQFDSRCDADGTHAMLTGDVLADLYRIGDGA